MFSYFFPAITVRTIYALVTAFLTGLVLGPVLIRRMRIRQYGQTIREDGPASHFSKQGIPTMGGVVIIIAMVITSLLWARPGVHIWVAVASILWLGALGFVDDLLIIIQKSSKGLSAAQKLIWQTALGLALGFFLYNGGMGEYLPYVVDMAGDKIRVATTAINVPFLGWFDLGVWYIPFVALVVVGASNAVNLTDGLDGLAIGTFIIVSIAYGGISYIAGNIKYAEHLKILYIPGTGELTIFCAAIVGAGLGFLWYNSFPAQIFMGDTGSLALGGAIAAVAVMTKCELLLAVVGGIFVIEALSVMIQVASFKLTGRRVFRMSPIHHHFELKGWPEPKVVLRFWIVAFIFALIGLSILGVSAMFISRVPMSGVY
ncbi:MAG: phospho-N-acetylmuramoyl-pentapeptide-transferase [Candidatus Wallbacteria bacterium HGW-Wallbacteria-1]|jgi:phospho-N-acetylmuramoyl-pentapeptide-transferase|uniref:Phospho-N-acetylmuramoyl-pentapeptide-transferase n=1 Tax=Candidatus Wallbacteria bacterium HGW-Wallbacteria-1 TaxID=2013854 RepID=A0A2N1PQC9_9BACT|nr:MAG: phospho-N-acetylmuramoyl-pentapeptide-transferase [Candidatus Wallbacteria bacterium HGW-Wallbacteria-1]